MKIKALCCFVGPVCMNAGDILDVSEAAAYDLIQAGYAKRIDEKAAPHPAGRTIKK